MIDSLESFLPPETVGGLTMYVTRLRKQSERLNFAAEEHYRLNHELDGGTKKDRGLMFTFVESELVTAVREGHWVLLDDIHSAPPEVVERLNSLAEEKPMLNLFESDKGEVLMSKPDSSGDISGQSYIHKNFVLLATSGGTQKDQANKLSTAFLNRVIRIYLEKGDADLALPEVEANLSKADSFEIVARKFEGVHGGIQIAHVLIGFHGAMCRMVTSGEVQTMANVTITLRTLLAAASTTALLISRGKSPLHAAIWSLLSHHIACVTDVVHVNKLLSVLREKVVSIKGAGKYSLLKLPSPTASEFEKLFGRISNTMVSFELVSRRLLGSVIQSEGIHWSSDTLRRVTYRFVFDVLIPQAGENADPNVLASLKCLHTKAPKSIIRDMSSLEQIQSDQFGGVLWDPSDLLREQLQLEKSLVELMLIIPEEITILDAVDRVAVCRRVSAVMQCIGNSIAEARNAAGSGCVLAKVLMCVERTCAEVRTICNLALQMHSNAISSLHILHNAIHEELEEKNLHSATFALHRCMSVPLRGLANSLSNFTEALSAVGVHSLNLQKFVLASAAASKYCEGLLRDSCISILLCDDQLSKCTLSKSELYGIQLTLSLHHAADLMMGRVENGNVVFTDAFEAAVQGSYGSTNAERQKLLQPLQQHCSGDIYKQLLFDFEVAQLADCVAVCRATAAAFNNRSLLVTSNMTLNYSHAVDSGRIQLFDIANYLSKDNGLDSRAGSLLASILPLTCSDIRIHLPFQTRVLFCELSMLVDNSDEEIILDTSTDCVVVFTNKSGGNDPTTSILLKLVDRSSWSGLSITHFLSEDSPNGLHSSHVDNLRNLFLSLKISIEFRRYTVATTRPYLPNTQLPQRTRAVLLAACDLTVALCDSLINLTIEGNKDINIVPQLEKVTNLYASSENVLLSLQDLSIKYCNEMGSTSITLLGQSVNLSAEFIEKTNLVLEWLSTVIPTLQFFETPKLKTDMSVSQFALSMRQLRGSNIVDLVDVFLPATLKKSIPRSAFGTITARDRILRCQARGALLQACDYVLDFIQSHRLSQSTELKFSRSLEFRNFYLKAAHFICSHLIGLAQLAETSDVLPPAAETQSLINKSYDRVVFHMINALIVSPHSSPPISPSSEVNRSTIEGWSKSLEEACQGFGISPVALHKAKLQADDFMEFFDLFGHTPDRLDDENTSYIFRTSASKKRLKDVENALQRLAVRNAFSFFDVSDLRRF